jgi:hypothetical protein
MLGAIPPVVEFGWQSEKIRLIGCVSKHNYYVDILYIYIYVCVFIYAHCSKSVNVAYMIGKDLQQFYCCNIKYALTSFCCSWNLSLPLDATVSFELTVCSVHFFRFFFLTSLNTKELKLWCPSLNKHYQKKNEFKRTNCISYAFRWIIILRVFILSHSFTSRGLSFSSFFLVIDYFFFFCYICETVTAGLCIHIYISD